jgi:hypothetical protein
VFSRRVVGWSIDSHQATPLVTNALGMAITNRTPIPDQTVIHSDHGSQYTSWAFTQRARDSGLLPSMGTIGDAYDNAVIESFWARMPTELLDRERWTTRLELANAIFEYLESSPTGNDATARSVGAPLLSTRSCTQPTSPDSHTPRSPNGAQTSGPTSGGRVSGEEMPYVRPRDGGLPRAYAAFWIRTDLPGDLGAGPRGGLVGVGWVLDSRPWRTRSQPAQRDERGLQLVDGQVLGGRFGV